MFLCELGGHNTDPGEAMVKIVAETREAEYYNKVRTTDEDGNYRGVRHIHSKGREIVREVPSCQKCIDTAIHLDKWPAGWERPDQLPEVVES